MLVPIVLLSTVFGGTPAPLLARLELQSDARFLLPSPMPAQVELSPTPPNEATGAAPGALWGRIPFGVDDGPGLLVAIDDAAGTCRIDLNRNSNLADDPPVEWKLLDDGSPSKRWEGTWKLPLPRPKADAGVVVYHYHPEAAKVRGLSANVLFCYRDHCLRGSVRMDNRDLLLVVSDEETRGDFRYPRGRSNRIRFGLDLDGNGQLDPTSEWFDAAGSAPAVGTQQVKLISVKPDEGTAELLVAPPGTRLAVPFAGTDTDGKPIRFPEDFKDRLVLVDFWGSYCPHCKRELPNLIELSRKFGGRADFAIVGISVDTPGAKEQLLNLIKEQNIGWRNLFDGQSWQTPAVKAYGVSSVPRPVLIDTRTMTIVADGGELRGPNLIQTVQNKLEARAGSK
ncbi:MAG: TlpA disulfide reductase family protein [Phycisphaerae bacterium]